MKRLLSILLLSVELAWPFVYPPAELPTNVLSEPCRCAAGGDCPCINHGGTCGCMEHLRGTLEHPADE